MLYCGAAEAAWEANDKDYSAGVSVPALALIGGPLCWLLCPQCLSPAQQRKRAAFSALWTAAVIVLMSLRASVLKIMAWLHSWSVAAFPADQGTDNAPEDSR
jgi:low temperature requirement protein LtrA